MNRIKNVDQRITKPTIQINYNEFHQKQSEPRWAEPPANFQMRTYQVEDLDPDGFESADFLRSAVWVLDSQLEWRLPIIHDNVSLG